MNVMENLDEQELVARLKGCDPAAFDEVFEKYRARLYAFLVRLSRRTDVAEDLLQETWIRLATRVSTLREDEKLVPWLYAVARNLYLSHMRSRMLFTDRLRVFSRLSRESASSLSPFEDVARDELEKRLERALASLPLRYREVFLLVAVEGMSHSEAATVCNLDPGALRKRLSRARSMLAARLKLNPQSVDVEAVPAGIAAKRRIAG